MTLPEQAAAGQPAQLPLGFPPQWNGPEQGRWLPAPSQAPKAGQGDPTHPGCSGGPGGRPGRCKSRSQGHRQLQRCSCKGCGSQVRRSQADRL